jgi:predicted small lipoprotein YifL
LIRPRDRRFWLALAIAFALGMGLAGCGRKAGLDQPPATAIVDPNAPTRSGGPGHDAITGAPVAPPGQRRTVPLLDWLID